ncbi:MAG: transposase [Firmicutes bacterium]|nr:transposase [Bacillota bacterium]
MAELDNKRLSLSRQAQLLSINRTSLYRSPASYAWSETDLADMRLIDRIYTAKPYYGYRRITDAMRKEGKSINEKRVRRLMRIMGIQGAWYYYLTKLYLCHWPFVTSL